MGGGIFLGILGFNDLLNRLLASPILFDESFDGLLLILFDGLLLILFDGLISGPVRERVRVD